VALEGVAKRIGWGYVGVLLGVLPFVPLIAYEPGGNDLASGLVGGAIGLVACLFLHDRKAGVSPQLAATRMLLAIACGAAGWFGLVGTVIMVGPARKDLLLVLVGSTLCVAPVAAAVGSMFRAERGAVFFEMASAAVAVPAFALLARQLLVLVPWLAFGPAARP